MRDGGSGGHGQRQLRATVRRGDFLLFGGFWRHRQQDGHPRVGGQPAGECSDQGEHAGPDLLQHGRAGDRLALAAPRRSQENAGCRLVQKTGQVRGVGEVQLRHRQLQRAEQAFDKQRRQRTQRVLHRRRARRGPGPEHRPGPERCLPDRPGVAVDDCPQATEFGRWRLRYAGDDERHRRDDRTHHLCEHRIRNLDHDTPVDQSTSGGAF
ncbi:hypothetical protein AAFH96_15960 [Polymorphospora sp. 2-325]|uniref:Uncharacterized protein n=1 Tax=Polymorphospora lycopeni TaxID=3140240 RepID=A0ABV5CUB6_9ACTN